MKNPKVTVLMSVYNSERFLKEAIESILHQTYKNFEFLIINDGSKDKSESIIKQYKDPRIRLISRENKGLTYSLNEGLQMAKGEYIARQDSDDISVKSRLKKEVEYLDTHSDVGLVGSNYTIIDTNGKKIVTTNVFTHHDDLKLSLITCNQYGHGSIMVRKSILDKVGNYDKRVGTVEDYDLWSRISRVSKVINFEEPLYLWRKSEESVIHSNHSLNIRQTFDQRDRNFNYFLAHRREFKVISWHPSGAEYRKRKSTMYRDLGYLYRMNDRWFDSFKMVVLAVLFQPEYKRNWKYLFLALYKPGIYRWTYEFL